MATGLRVYGGDSRVGALTQKVSHLTSLKVKGSAGGSPACVAALVLDLCGAAGVNIVVAALLLFHISWM